MRLNLAELFQTRTHDYGALHALVATAIDDLAQEPDMLGSLRGSNSIIDLGGRSFVLDKPLDLHDLSLVTLANGTIIAGPDFPEDEFLVRIHKVHGVQLRNLFLECSKRANGIRVENFFRVRIEDCYLVHQLSYGIYSAPKGNNHELEIFKCHIAEFLHGDGYPKRRVNYGVIPAFDIDDNRRSTGIFLGQADNVVAWCNINLCRVGIHSGMRANRIHGNHITGGASRNLELFRGIELNNFHKSSAMIVNNYIDNCCLWINCSADARKNLRNYFHVTDNLFYRGYNHPRAGGEFSHIVINPLEPGSLIANLHVCDNKFYNQPENLNGEKPRVIRPVQVTENPVSGGELASLDHSGVTGVTMKNNYFTNCFPTFVVPMGTDVTRIIETKPEQSDYRVDFTDMMPIGEISNATLDVLEYQGSDAPRCSIRRIQGRKVTIAVTSTSRARIAVRASADRSSGPRYDYIVH